MEKKEPRKKTNFPPIILKLASARTRVRMRKKEWRDDSVTRCCNKSSPNLTKSCPKCSDSSFYLSKRG